MEGRQMKDKWVTLIALTSLCATALLGAQSTPQPTASLEEKARQAASEGKIAYQLTTPEELNAVLGPPASEKKEQDGGMEMLTLQYVGLMARFTRLREIGGPFTLQALNGRGNWLDNIIGGGAAIDIGQNRPVVLRSTDDLAKFDSFWGFAGASLAGLDLREHKATLEKMPFDSRTQWPARDKLPESFDPARRLEESKGPGLGVAGLHAQGLDGHGVGITIIDQPLLRDHEEYAGQVVRYEAIGVFFNPVEMHGPPVCSIAVGQKCGVAPKASLYYYAVPPWQWLDNKPWAEQLEKIIEFNKTLTDQPKIRVVSISLGAFSQRPNFDLWKAAVEKASQNGILVVTCDPTFLRLATLRRDPNGDPNDPSCYTTGRYSALGAALCVPAGNRTTASHYGRDVYTYWIEGGMSWAVPYLAGLAALAFQIDPEIPPAQIVELWTSTATKSSAGPIVNPPKFIEAVRSRTKKAP
jgi:serine protease AprX